MNYLIAFGSQSPVLVLLAAWLIYKLAQERE
jgi:hypothetical protein